MDCLLFTNLYGGGGSRSSTITTSSTVLLIVAAAVITKINVHLHTYCAPSAKLALPCQPLLSVSNSSRQVLPSLPLYRCIAWGTKKLINWSQVTKPMPNRASFQTQGRMTAMPSQHQESLGYCLSCWVPFRKGGGWVPAVPRYSLFNNGVCFLVHFSWVFLNEIHHNSYLGSGL